MRYYFDLTNGYGLVRDEVGQVIENQAGVELEVSRILTDVARDELPETWHGKVKVDVRDAEGHAVCRGSISFEKRWLPSEVGFEEMLAT